MTELPVDVNALKREAAERAVEFVRSGMVLGLGTPMNNALMTQQFESDVPNLFPISGARSMVEPRHPMKFTQRGIYYDEMRAAVKYFIEEKGKKAVCAIYQDTDYGQEILEGVED